MDGFILQIASRGKKGMGKKAPAHSESEGEETEGSEESAPEGHDEIIADALDTLAGVLRVSSEDREKFDSAMSDLAEAIADRAVAESKPESK